jgi:hypothetical protein
MSNRAYMRRPILALLVSGLCFGAAQAASTPPHFKRRAPYPEVRRELIGRGFDPVRILYYPHIEGHACKDEAYDTVCAAYREVLYCRPTGGPSECEFLYRRRADNRYWIVFTSGEPESSRAQELHALRYLGIAPASQDDLDGLIVLRPDGSRFRFRYSKPVPTRLPTPLCSEVGGKTPCWIKPPPRR